MSRKWWKLFLTTPFTHQFKRNPSISLHSLLTNFSLKDWNKVKPVIIWITHLRLKRYMNTKWRYFSKFSMLLHLNSSQSEKPFKKLMNTSPKGSDVSQPRKTFLNQWKSTTCSLAHLMSQLNHKIGRNNSSTLSKVTVKILTHLFSLLLLFRTDS